MDTAKAESRFSRRQFLVALHAGAALVGLGAGAAWLASAKGQQASHTGALEKEIADGNRNTIVVLACEYLEGKHVPKDLNKAFALFKQAAEAGDTFSMGKIGFMYALGQGTPKDLPQAIKWTTKAAEGGEASAAYNLAVFYDKGFGVPQDDTQGLMWLERAAQGGHVPSMMQMGMYLQKKDPVSSCAWFRAAELAAPKELDWTEFEPKAKKAADAGMAGLAAEQREQAEAKGVLLYRKVMDAKAAKFKVEMLEMLKREKK